MPVLPRHFVSVASTGDDSHSFSAALGKVSIWARGDICTPQLSEEGLFCGTGSHAESEIGCSKPLVG